MNIATDTRHYIVRLTTKELLELEESGKATVLLTRQGGVPENESSEVEAFVTAHYLRQNPGRVVVGCTAILVTPDRYNTERLLVAAQIKKDKK